MLFKLSLSNLRKSVKDYAVYFFTLVIGVAVFYVFNSIDSQTAYLKISNDTRSIVELLTSLISSVSVFVAVVLGLLIVYASRFLMKRRNKEFALYLILGMGKGRISAILFLETFAVGLLSLAAGIGVGVIASQFTSTLAANLFEADMSDYHFVFSAEAVAKTAVCFGILYLAVMLFNSFMVGGCKLIDLIQSGRKSENMKLKNPVVCVLTFIPAAAALGFAYYKVAFVPDTLTQNKFFLMIAIGAASTYFIFRSVSGMLLRIIMSAKKVYYRGLNSFTFRQLSSKVNTMVMSMTMICLMLFVTICALSSAFSMRNSLNGSVEKYCPADFCIEMKGSGEQAENFVHCGNDELLSYFDEYIEINEYADENITIGGLLGDDLEKVKAENPYLQVLSQLPIYRLSDYNALMRFYGRDEISMGSDEFVLVSNYTNSAQLYNSVLKKGKTITVGGRTLSSAYGECKDGFVELSVQPINDGLILVPDDSVAALQPAERWLTANYKADSKDDKLKTDEEIGKILERNAKKCPLDSYEERTRRELADAAVGMGGIVTFLGLYIGIIFLISSGVILALRSLSDSVDSIGRYAMLRKIGADERDISKSIFRQNLLFFAIPLLLAAVHSIFGMRFAMKFVLQIFGTEGMALSVAGSAIVILLIYGGYFLITTLCSKSIARNKQ